MSRGVMPSIETKKLPKGLRYRYNAYYYQVPAARRGEFGGMTEIKVGKTRKDAMAFYWDCLAGPDDDLPELEAEGLVNQLYTRSKKSAKARKIAHVMTRQEVQDLVDRASGRCEVTGLRLRSSPRQYMATVDRIDSGLPYRFSNCRIVCLAANVAMGPWGEGILREMAVAYIAKNLPPQPSEKTPKKEGSSVYTGEIISNKISTL